jgi:hypothetical protein
MSARCPVKPQQGTSYEHRTEFDTCQNWKPPSVPAQLYRRGQKAFAPVKQ